MATEKQIAANRANALLSTGPRTYSGRESSKLNALRHGMTAKTLILRNEKEMDFDDFAAEMMKTLAPVGVLETEFVNRIVMCLWRLRRGAEFEAAYLNWVRERMEFERDKDFVGELIDIQLNVPQPPASSAVGQLIELVSSGPDVLGRVARHEKTLSNEITKLLKEFKGLQLERLDKEKRAAV